MQTVLYIKNIGAISKRASFTTNLPKLLPVAIQISIGVYKSSMNHGKVKAGR